MSTMKYLAVTAGLLGDRISTTSHQDFLNNYENIEITLLDGTITTDVSTTCDQVAKVKLWYPESTAAIKFQGSETFSPAVKTVDYCKTDNFTIMDYMFYYCQSLTNLDLSTWNTSKATTYYYMFYANNNLKNIQFAADLTNVTSMSYMFTENYKLENSPTFINAENATKLQNFQYTFQKCRALKEIDLSELRGPALTSISYAFDECEALTTLRLDNFEGPKVTNYSYAFHL